ncbi:hypothetical protein B1M_01905 [Burkholderia sp. TJI49]|nr:hypothetical protein B1M_01905 [Burkholderia sp. TJI49]
MPDAAATRLRVRRLAPTAPFLRRHDEDEGDDVTPHAATMALHVPLR